MHTYTPSESDPIAFVFCICDDALCGSVFNSAVLGFFHWDILNEFLTTFSVFDSMLSVV